MTRATVVTVRGTDRKVAVSPLSVVAGRIVFRVSNAGRKPHVFVVHRRSLRLAPGRSDVLSVQLAAGTYPIVWSGVPPRGLVVKPPTPTVDVTMYEYGYTLSLPSVPAGPVTFRLVNTGHLPHDFSIQGIARSQTLQPGGTGTLSVTLAAGTYAYLCTIQGHAEQGMTGTLTVT